MTLTLAEAREAYRAGLDRSSAARARSGTHSYGWKPSPAHQRRVDGESAVAEALVAKVTGREWLSDGLVPDAIDAGDVAGGLSVRWTERENGCLILHPGDPDDLVAVLVVGNAPAQRVVGWIEVGEAKRVGRWRDDVRYPAFFIAQASLRPMSELP